LLKQIERKERILHQLNHGARISSSRLRTNTEKEMNIHRGRPKRFSVPLPFSMCGSHATCLVTVLCTALSDFLINAGISQHHVVNLTKLAEKQVEKASLTVAAK
jgi:hypothetical protein